MNNPSYKEDLLEIITKNVSRVRNLSQGRNNFDKSIMKNATHGIYDPEKKIFRRIYRRKFPGELHKTVSFGLWVEMHQIRLKHFYRI